MILFSMILYSGAGLPESKCHLINGIIQINQAVISTNYTLTRRVNDLSRISELRELISKMMTITTKYY